MSGGLVGEFRILTSSTHQLFEKAEEGALMVGVSLDIEPPKPEDYTFQLLLCGKGSFLVKVKGSGRFVRGGRDHSISFSDAPFSRWSVAQDDGGHFTFCLEGTTALLAISNGRAVMDESAEPSPHSTFDLVDCEVPGCVPFPFGRPCMKISDAADIINDTKVLYQALSTLLSDKCPGSNPDHALALTGPGGGCMSLKCDACGTVICGFCLRNCHPDAHPHLSNGECKYNPFNGDGDDGARCGNRATPDQIRRARDNAIQDRLRAEWAASTASPEAKEVVRARLHDVLAPRGFVLD
eukprot:gene11296-8028_t